MTNQQKLLKTFDEIDVHYVIKYKDEWSYVFLVGDHLKQEYEQYELGFMLRQGRPYFEFYNETEVGYS